jgi:hypothetical protein
MSPIAWRVERLAAEAASLVGMIVGVILIGRSKSLAEVCADPVDAATVEAECRPAPPERAEYLQ